MQIVVLSGKGGTGKTTVAVSLAELFDENIKIDCDVDAANMHMFFNGKQISKEKYSASCVAKINIDKCVKCNKCMNVCKFDAISDYKVDPVKCEGCKVCGLVCKFDAIEFIDDYTADIIEDDVRNGKLIRSDMTIGADGSGKLITKLRQKVTDDSKIAIIDGSPGIGCSVIASITNTDLCLIVTEPTLSGMSDLKRIYKLAKKLGIKSYVCINKYDLNEEVTKEIEYFCSENKIDIIGKIHYDDNVIKSINNLIPVVLYEDSVASKDIKDMYNKLIKIINGR